MAGRGAALGGSPFLPAQRSATDRCQGNGRLKDGGLRRTDDSPPPGAPREGPGCELWGQGASGGWGLEHSEVGHGGPGRNVGIGKIPALPWLGLGPAETSVSLGVLGCVVGAAGPPLAWAGMESLAESRALQRLRHSGQGLGLGWRPSLPRVHPVWAVPRGMSWGLGEARGLLPHFLGLGQGPSSPSGSEADARLRFANPRAAIPLEKAPQEGWVRLGPSSAATSDSVGSEVLRSQQGWT